MSGFIKHPFERTIIDVERFSEVKCCTVNKTHIDFYKECIPAGKEHGEPDLIIKFESEEQRNEWFDNNLLS